jgi:hypothetical protein
MSISNFRSSQALYLVIIRDRNAEQLLKDWARSANAAVTIENNRMKIFEQRSLSLFQLNWPHNWNDVTIWDYWKREHINLA